MAGYNNNSYFLLALGVKSMFIADHLKRSLSDSITLASGVMFLKGQVAEVVDASTQSH